MFSKRIGVDLGTANCLVWVVGSGIVLNEPTVVAVSVDDNRVLAVGSEAKEMLGRTPGSIVASRPMQDGVIADYVVTEALLKYLIGKVMGRFSIVRPEVMICVPAGVTQVERKAVLDATLAAGAKSAYLIDEPLAASIGAKLPIAEPRGNMVLDMGGGASEVAVISLGGIVVHKSVRVAGNKLDQSIINYLRRSHNLMVGDQTAEEVKINIGSAIVVEKPLTMEVKGRDVLTGLPRSVAINSNHVAQSLKNELFRIVGIVKAVLEETPPELTSDIIDRGVVMTGGTALLRNFDKLLSNEIGVPFHVSEDPLKCVAQGTGIAMENLDLYKKSTMKFAY